jgi:hypothetical protein
MSANVASQISKHNEARPEEAVRHLAVWLGYEIPREDVEAANAGTIIPLRPLNVGS